MAKYIMLLLFLWLQMACTTEQLYDKTIIADSDLIDIDNIKEKPTIKRNSRYVQYKQQRRDSISFFKTININMLYAVGDDFPWQRDDNVYSAADSAAALKYFNYWVHDISNGLAREMSRGNCVQEVHTKNIIHLAYGYDSITTLKYLTLFYLKAKAGELTLSDNLTEDIRYVSECYTDLETAVARIPYAYYIAKNEMSVEQFLTADCIPSTIAYDILDRYPQFRDYKPIAKKLKEIKKLRYELKNRFK